MVLHMNEKRNFLLQSRMTKDCVKLEGFIFRYLHIQSFIFQGQNFLSSQSLLLQGMSTFLQLTFSNALKKNTVQRDVQENNTLLECGIDILYAILNQIRQLETLYILKTKINMKYIQIFSSVTCTKHPSYRLIKYNKFSDAQRNNGFLFSDSYGTYKHNVDKLQRRQCLSWWYILRIINIQALIFQQKFLWLFIKREKVAFNQ